MRAAMTRRQFMARAGITAASLPTAAGLLVPSPDGTDEGDGWVLTYVYDAATERSELAVLDAADVAAGPVGTVELPVRVPHGFHAAWVPAN